MVRRRRAVRRFDPSRPVGRDALDRLVAAAVRGPTAGGTPGRSLLVLHDRGDVDAFWVATAPSPADGPSRWLEGMRSAPVVVVVLAEPGAYVERYARPDKARAAAERGGPDAGPPDWPVPWWDVDAGMAALLLLLGAVDDGLGGCPFGVPAAGWDALRHRFAVPEGRRPVVAVALGHPAADHGSRSSSPGRPPLGALVHDGRHGRPWVVGTG